MHLRNDSPSLFSLTLRAREMRRAPTKSEALLWAQLRGRKLGPRVRRQHVLHPYVADFYVIAHKLVIEVDGGIHRFQREHDLVPLRGSRSASRDRWLANTYGVRVLRIDAELVERDVLAAIAIIRAAL